MTKVTIIGQPSVDEKPKKKIELIHLVPKNAMGIHNAIAKPREWRNIELISRKTNLLSFDVMLCYDEDRNRGCIYLGHFNDGIV